MKSESVVIADQQAAVNTFSGLVHTARQANKVGGGRRAPQGELSRIQRWGLSRNKVSLAEAGDGSPPFYLKNWCHRGFTEIRLNGIQDEADYTSRRERD